MGQEDVVGFPDTENADAVGIALFAVAALALELVVVVVALPYDVAVVAFVVGSAAVGSADPGQMID